MRLLSGLLVTFATLARAEIWGDTGPDNATTPVAIDGEITIHKITVGKLQNSFEPNSIQAKPGDIVEFTFYPTNHSVIRAAYGYPCVPYENIVASGSGFTSGPMHANSIDNLPTWNVTVNDTQPVFFYCGAPGSCFGWGMLGVINADSETDLVKQIAIARQEAYEVWPGQSIPAEALQSLVSIAATATLMSTSTSMAQTTTSLPTAGTTTTAAAVAATSSATSLSVGAIAGIAIGAAAVVLIAAGLFFFLGRSRRNQKERYAQQHRLSYGQPTLVQYGGGDANYMGHFHKQPLLPPYISSPEPKSPHLTASPLTHFPERQSYMEMHSVSHSNTSELDGATVVSTAQVSPQLGTVQEGSAPFRDEGNR